MREAAREQLTPEDYDYFEDLMAMMMVYGLTPHINAELGKLVSKFKWELEISESPEWTEALIACDRAFLGEELKKMCRENSLSTRGHKKELCLKLYWGDVKEVVDIIKPYLEALEATWEE